MKQGEIIGKKIKAAREKQKLSQIKLSEAMGWNTHQILLNIESGTREVKAWELAQIAKCLKIDLVDLLEEASDEKNIPYLLWRKTPVEREVEIRSKFLKQCEGYYFLEQALGITTSTHRPLPRLDISIMDLKEAEVEEQANFIRKTFNLGHYPAVTLSKILEDYFGVKFIQFDLYQDSSAASTKCDLGACMLINSRDTPWRQKFSVAHELFHILTWNESLFRKKKNDEKFHHHNEQMAHAFAAGLLMPEESIREEIRHVPFLKKCPISDLMAIARKYEVSLQAFLFRLKKLKFITGKIYTQIEKDSQFQIWNTLVPQKAEYDSTHLGDRLIWLGYQALSRGIISRIQLAEILEISPEQLKNYMEEKGIPTHAETFVKLHHA